VARLRRGWSIEDVLFTPSGIKPGDKFKIIVIPKEFIKLNKYKEEKNNGK
jgi:hypothetical protein